MSDADLRQADLSHLSLAEMTQEQRAEMRRRYDDFVKRLAKPPAAGSVLERAFEIGDTGKHR